MVGASAEIVWTDLSNLRSHADWMRDATEVLVDGEERVGVGTTFQARTVVGPLRILDRMEVTEWDPGRSMAVRHLGPVTGTGRFTLAREPADETLVVWEEELRFPWWLGGRIGAWVASPILRRLFRANLDAFAARYR